MKSCEVNQSKQGTMIQGFYLVKTAECRTTATGKKYLDLLLADGTGEFPAKLWDCSQEDEERFVSQVLIKVKGTISEWQNKPQLKVEKIRLTEAADNVAVTDFVPAAPRPADEMYQELQSYIAKIGKKDIRDIVRTIIEEKKEKLLVYPAAKQNHHAIRSGLIYHILTMLQAGEKMCQIYTALDSDLLFAGIMLHDIAKLDEMDSSEWGIVSQYTTEGELLGHIIQGIKLIERTAELVGADREVSLLLQHMVLSHHYEPEFGSPKKPMIPEGEMLHHLDMIDARMYDMQKVLTTTEAGQVSDKVWVLENRKLYRPAVKDGNLV